MKKLVILSAIALLIGSCNQKKSDNSDLSVGFIYIGSKSDYGYNQAHSEGANYIKETENVKILEEENIPETENVQKSMESMIKLDGVKLIFPTSFGYYDPHILKVAKEYPDVTFLHCGGLYNAEKDPKNVASYFGYIDEAEYLAGMAAGLTTKTNKLGFIAAKPIPQVLRNINAYTLGARSVNPKVTVTVIFTGDWFMPVKEAEAVNSLADQNIDVVTGHVDSPKVIIETAEKRGIFSTGYHVDQTKLASKGYLTGAVWNWKKVYSDFIKKYKKGEKVTGLFRGGIKEGVVGIAPFGPSVNDATKKQINDVLAEFKSEKGFTIFKGPLKNNKGQIIIEQGKELKQTDPILEKMDYLVEGVIGEVSTK